jgi:hypothetical protein
VMRWAAAGPLAGPRHPASPTVAHLTCVKGNLGSLGRLVAAADRQPLCLTFCVTVVAWPRPSPFVPTRTPPEPSQC